MPDDLFYVGSHVCVCAHASYLFQYGKKNVCHTYMKKLSLCLLIRSERKH